VNGCTDLKEETFNLLPLSLPLSSPTSLPLSFSLSLSLSLSLDAKKLRTRRRRTSTRSRARLFKTYDKSRAKLQLSSADNITFRQFFIGSTFNRQ